MGHRWVAVVAGLGFALGVLIAGAVAPVSAWDDAGTDDRDRFTDGSDHDDDLEEVTESVGDTVDNTVEGTADVVNDVTDGSSPEGEGDAGSAEPNSAVRDASTVTGVVSVDGRMAEAGSLNGVAGEPGGVRLVATLAVGGTDAASLSARAGHVRDRTPPIETAPPVAPISGLPETGAPAVPRVTGSPQGSAAKPASRTDGAVGDRELLRDPRFRGSREHAGPGGAADGGSPRLGAAGGVIGDLEPFVGVPVPAVAVPFWAVLLVFFLKPIASVLGAVAGAVGEYGGRVASALRFGNGDDDPLSHDVRARIAEEVDASPGITLTELADRSDASLSSIRYHLRVLEAERLLTSEKIHGNRRFFPNGTANEELFAALDDEPTGTIIRELRAREAASVGELVQMVDRSYSTVSYHLDRLSQDGLVVQAKEGKRKVTRLAPWVRAALETDAGDVPRASGHEVGAD